MQTITTDDIKKSGNKIVSVTKKEGACTYYCAKYFQTTFAGETEFIVITRKGIETYITQRPEMVPYIGKKGVHFEKFSSPAKAATYINQQLSKIAA